MLGDEHRLPFAWRKGGNHFGGPALERGDQFGAHRGVTLECHLRGGKPLVYSHSMVLGGLLLTS